MANQSHVVKDPVCGMDMKPKEVQARAEHEGRTYYFCSSMCREKFDSEPKRYADKKVA